MDRNLIKEWIRSLIEKESYWFHKIELAPDLITPGWSDPEKDKPPFFGLPTNMRGMRVLDVGCCEGFFSFEAERRGAREVVAIDPAPDAFRRFNIVEIGSGLTLPALRVVCMTSIRRPSVRSIWYCFTVYSITCVILCWLRKNSICLHRDTIDADL